MVITSLPTEWRTRATHLRDWAAASDAATAWEASAAELEQALSENNDQLLDLQRAAVLSGYSADHVGRLIRSGKIPNAGRAHAPRIRLSDLPRKPGATNGRPQEPPDRRATKQLIARAVLLREKDGSRE